MKTLLLALVMAWSVGAAIAGDATQKAGSDDPERMAAARKLMTVMGVTRQLETSLSVMKQSFLKGADAASDDERAEFSAGFENIIKRIMVYRDDMLTDIAKLYANHFTANEMDVVTKFYSSGIGAKFVKLTPKLMSEAGAIGVAYSRKMMDELKRGKSGE